MKKLFLLLICGILPFIVSCEEEIVYKTQSVTVRLDYPEKSIFSAEDGVTVTLKSTTSDAIFTSTTNDLGNASFTILPGIYEASVSDVRSQSGVNTIFNGSKSGIIVTNDWENDGYIIRIALSESRTSQIVIKEFYTGGCQKDDNSGSFSRDAYLIVYNNSDTKASLKNMCFGATNPYNSTMATNYDMTGSSLWYEGKNQIPLGCGFFSFGENGPDVEPGEQVVIAMNGAINHTTTYTNSVDLSKAEYYVCYDPESGLSNALYYPAPSENIPSSHYLDGYKFGAGNALVVSVNSAAAFIFTPQDNGTIAAFFESVDNISYYNNKTSDAMKRKMVPNKWILDGMEIFKFGVDNNVKRLTPAIDAGSTFYTVSQGYTLYRNVNKEATEAIEGNAAKLIYNYSDGTADIEGGSTDPSGIDAEASILNGARIIYMDTNNSTNDFHQRKVSSLK